MIFLYGLCPLLNIFFIAKFLLVIIQGFSKNNYIVIKDLLIQNIKTLIWINRLNFISFQINFESKHINASMSKQFYDFLKIL